MTDRKLLLDDLMKHSSELEIRVRERDEVNAELAFGYSVSHDLRAPSLAIWAFAEALREHRGQKFVITLLPPTQTFR